MFRYSRLLGFRAVRVLIVLFVSMTCCFGATISLPGGSLSVSGTTSAGASFTYSGTLTQADTLAFTETGLSCLQSSGTYCTNGAGVVVVAGTTGIGGTSSFSGTFNGTSSTWNFGALLLEISGVGTVQVFPANSANGLGSATPPSLLTLNGASLSSLGFGNFSVVNPTITFVVADTFFGDNSGSFSLQQSGSSVVPEPSTLLMFGTGALGLCGLVRRKLQR